ncbi:MAG: c-type cytochrome [Gemmobacter sp.]
MSKLRDLALCTALAGALAAPAAAQVLGLGRAALPEEIDAWDVAVLPDGQGLRPGSGSVEDGEELFVEHCASCHGDFAEGIDSWPPLAGGRNTLTDPRPLKTVGSYWPYLSTVWDYVHRSMPFGAAQTLSVDEVYAITAYILYSNGLVEDDFVLSHENFTEIRLPNEDGFYVDDRDETEVPLFSQEPCMTDCLPAVRITRRAVDLGVTPTDPDGRPAGTIPPILASLATEQEADGDIAEPAEADTAGADAVAALDPELVARGERAFRQCVACHKVGDGARNGTGPHLNNTVNAPAGHADGFRYSNALLAMAAEGLVWTPENLDAFLADPRGFMRGTRMSYNGMRSAEDREAVIAYLSTFAD